MKIVVSECQAFQPFFMTDLSKYDTVDKWISAVLNEESSFVPFDLMVYYEKQWFAFVRNAQIVDDAKTNLNIIKKLPKRIRNIWNDNIVVKADIFEHELVFYLDVYDEKMLKK